MPFFVFIVDGVGGADFFTVAAFSLGQLDAVFGVNGIFQRNGLGVFDIDGLSFPHGRIVFIVHLFGTFFRAGPAGDTFVRVHITGMLQNADLKIARFPLKGGDFRKCEQLNVDVPADLDQFR
jgi:hypothetical protein